jgi:outer membrane protein OmpA-like peptidoglycan-associated protein
MPMNTRNLAWLVVLPGLAVLPVFAGPRVRDFAPAAALSPAVASTATEAAWLVGDSIHFGAGGTQIRPSDAKVLDAHAALLRGNRMQRLLIEGYADGVGDSAFGRQIGEQRAKSAKAYLVSKGAPADQIAVSSGAGGVPACGEKTATCRAANRRATLSTGVLP